MPDFVNTASLVNPIPMGQYGDATAPSGGVSVPGTVILNDNIRPVLIPAGMTVNAILLANDDLDSNGTPLAAFSLGFVPRSALDGPLVQNLTYFAAAGQQLLRNPNLGTLFCNFAPIKFEQDVWLNLNITTAPATSAAGLVRATVLGSATGVR